MSKEAVYIAMPHGLMRYTISKEGKHMIEDTLGADPESEVALTMQALGMAVRRLEELNSQYPDLVRAELGDIDTLIVSLGDILLSPMMD